MPCFTVWGLQLRYLKIVDRSGYNLHLGLNNLITNDKYLIRMSWKLR
jgi:hypothetical protein